MSAPQYNLHTRVKFPRGINNGYSNFSDNRNAHVLLFIWRVDWVHYTADRYGVVVCDVDLAWGSSGKAKAANGPIGCGYRYIGIASIC